MYTVGVNVGDDIGCIVVSEVCENTVVGIAVFCAIFVGIKVINTTGESVGFTVKDVNAGGLIVIFNETVGSEEVGASIFLGAAVFNVEGEFFCWTKNLSTKNSIFLLTNIIII